MENRISCSTVMLIAVLLFILFSFMRECSTGSELAAKFAKEDSAKKARSEIYKKRFNFNIDSIIQKFKQRKILSISKLLKSPIVIFRQLKDEIYLDDSLNKSIPRSLVSFLKDSIKTIVLIQHEVNNVGYYSNKKTVAYQTNIIIHFIDMKTLNEVNYSTIYGGSPAQTTFYRHAAPEAVYGSEPSFNEIKNLIISKLNK